ncbi:ATP-binding cassette domain-containing protein [bacterium]|nr:ATP-binding cassette domain-containing protein [bacterium]
MTTENNLVVRVRDVVKTYQDGLVRALRGVSLDIPAGSFLTLAGPSGSGKTTLLNLIGALDVPTEGTITLIGRDLASLDEKQSTILRRENIGFIFQDFNLVPVLTARENVELPLEILSGWTKQSRRDAAMDILDKVGIADMANRLPKELSGGQQQRVAIARALVKKPPIVLADEPTANLDGKTGVAVIDLMKRMRDEIGTAFITSSHDPRVIERSETDVRLIDGQINPDGGGAIE